MRGIVPVALTPFTPDETRAQRGTAVLVFRSRRCARAVEGSRPGIWKMRLEGGHETLLAPGTQFLFTDSWSEGICFLNVDKNPPEIEQMDFATDRARRVGTLDVGSLATDSVFGISVSPDGKWLLYSRLDHAESNIMLVENFR